MDLSLARHYPAGGCPQWVTLPPIKNAKELELWYNAPMSEHSPRRGPSSSGRLIGFQGYLARPFGGLLGTWAVLCGMAASHRFRWQGEDLLTLALVWLLVEPGWGSLWSLTTGSDWFHRLAAGWPPSQPAAVAALPYSQPQAAAGRLRHWLSRLLGWGRETLWPQAGPSLLGLIGALVLIGALSRLLPTRFRPLQAILAAVIGLGLIQRCRGRAPLAGEAFVLVALTWWAGHLAFAPLNWPSLALALAFALAVWGSLRLEAGLRGGLWLLDGGQVLAAALLIGLKQPLAAGAVGLLLLGQGAWQLTLPQGGEAGAVARRMRPWLMAAMAVAAWVVP